MQTSLFEKQQSFEEEILKEKNIIKRKQKLTNYTILWGNKVVNEAWKLGDAFWTKYDEKF
jgi:hypothetical protein